MTLTLPAPLLHDITPTFLDVPDGRRTVHHCRLDDTALTWDDERVRYDAITAIGYGTRARSLNLVQRHLTREIRIHTGTGLLHIALGLHAFGPSHEDMQHAAYTTLLATLHGTVEPRLRSQILRSMAAGDAVDVGSLRLTAQSLQQLETGERLGWRQLPTAELDGDLVTVRTTIERDLTPVARFSMLTPNAPLLPELLDEAAIAFA